MPRLSLPVIAATSLVCTVARAQQEVGTLDVVRQVKVTTAPVSAPHDYVDAHNGQTVRNGFGVRTLRRSRAQINFKDKSVLRINERTDIVVLDAPTLRRIQLEQGAVWVKVAKGVNTTVQTPTATATARGTEYQVFSNGDLFVYEGAVDLTVGGKVISVSAGNKVTFGADGKPSEPTRLEPSEMPQGRGGGAPSWINMVASEAGNSVTNGGADFNNIRTNGVNEFAKPPDKAQLDIIIRSRAPGMVDPHRENGLIDNTETNYALPALALAATVAADYGQLGDTISPALSGAVFGYSGTPSFAGMRVDAAGVLGQSRYFYEANALQFLHDPETGLLPRFGSILEMERPVAEGLTVFAGRRRFFHGPVFANLVNTQLIANRYSGAGFRFDRRAFSAEAAYVYDSNSLVQGAQVGALGSVFLKAYGGILGGHFLETKEVPGGGHGKTVSLAMPLIPNQIDFYGEFGTGIDGTTNETAGAYLPGVFQKTGVDVFFEYGRKRGVAQAYSLTGLYDIPKGPQIRVSLESVEGTNRLSLGAAYRF